MTGSMKKGIRAYAKEYDLTLQDVVTLALERLLRKKRKVRIYSSLTKSAPEELIIRLPKDVVDEATHFGEERYVTFAPVLFTAIVLLLDDAQFRID